MEDKKLSTEEIWTKLIGAKMIGSKPAPPNATKEQLREIARQIIEENKENGY